VSVNSSRDFRKRVLRTVPVEDSHLPVLLLTNICHLSNKLDDLSVVVRDLKPTVVCLTETWLDSSVPDIAIDLYGYHAFRKDRSSGCGGGVAVYVLNEVQCRRLLDYERDLYEIMWICLDLSSYLDL
jgi:hypothetical protein